MARPKTHEQILFIKAREKRISAENSEKEAEKIMKNALLMGLKDGDFVEVIDEKRTGKIWRIWWENSVLDYLVNIEFEKVQIESYLPYQLKKLN